MHKHISLAIRIARHQIRGGAIKDHQLTIGTDLTIGAEAVELRPVTGDTHARGFARETVVRKNIALAIHISRHQIACRRGKNHHLAIRADIASKTEVIGL